jgi:hypothetical protein
MASVAMLKRTWPAYHDEAMMLIHLVRVAAPSLADVLALGMISVLAPTPRASAATIQLAYRTAVLGAVAYCANGDQVPAPHLHPSEVTHLEVTDLAVGNDSYCGMCG